MLLFIHSRKVETRSAVGYIFSLPEDDDCRHREGLEDLQS